jgi:hypothetical protein
MSPRPISQDGNAVFRQDRRKLLRIGLIGIVFIAMGASFIVDPQFWQTRKFSAYWIDILGWLITPLFSLGLVAVAVSLVRPTTVKLGQDGIVVRTPWRTYSRPWDALSGFRLWEYRRNCSVVFNDATPPNIRLAAINRRLMRAARHLLAKQR